MGIFYLQFGWTDPLNLQRISNTKALAALMNCSVAVISLFSPISSSLCVQQRKYLYELIMFPFAQHVRGELAVSRMKEY